MRTIVAVIAALTVLGAAKPLPANFLQIVISEPDSATVRVIWRPYAGAVSSRGEDQQARLRTRRGVTNADSLRRWNDPSSRDTVLIGTPAELIVDMTAGPVIIEAAKDSVRVEAQLTPRRGVVVGTWGAVLVVESDAITPSVTRKR